MSIIYNPYRDYISEEKSDLLDKISVSILDSSLEFEDKKDLVHTSQIFMIFFSLDGTNISEAISKATEALKLNSEDNNLQKCLRILTNPLVIKKHTNELSCVFSWAFFGPDLIQNDIYYMIDQVNDDLQLYKIRLMLINKFDNVNLSGLPEKLKMSILNYQGTANSLTINDIKESFFKSQFLLGELNE